MSQDIVHLTRFDPESYHRKSPDNITVPSVVLLAAEFGCVPDVEYFRMLYYV